MASKIEMIQDMVKTAKDFQLSLDEMGVTEIKFLKWLDSLTDYDRVRSGNKFFHGQFLKQLMIIKQVLSNHPQYAWVSLKLHSRNERLVVLLRNITRHAKEMWFKRPQFKVKRSQ